MAGSSRSPTIIWAIASNTILRSRVSGRLNSVRTRRPPLKDSLTLAPASERLAARLSRIVVLSRASTSASQLNPVADSFRANHGL